MNKITKALLTLFILWIIIFLAMIIPKELNIQTGKTILLKASPVDPRDLFRGDYVILSYDNLSTIYLENLMSNYQSDWFYKDSNIYVTLDISGKVAIPVDVDTYLSKKLTKNQIIIKGKVTDKLTKPDRLKVDYGIENYYVPEGEGLKIERIRDNTLSAKISVDNEGNCVLKSLLINNKELNLRKYTNTLK